MWKEIANNLTNKTLKRNFTDQQFGRLLVSTDLTQSDCTGAVPPRFSDISTSLTTTFTVPGELTRRNFGPGHFCRGPLCFLSGSTSEEIEK